ncbi:MAG: hypothetical protein H0X64_12585 [Gemmatimonadaceae bacterium]|nr:hypothetical protein [Gemmatimonadaceae bacterium]
MTSPEHSAAEREVDNPLRDEQRHAVRDELEGRLRHRGAALVGSESDAEVVELSNAVDRFERAVMQSGGDLMVDTPESSSPDNPANVLPQRRADESVGSYIQRISAATDGVGSVR